ncbi:MAG: hypothetical protein CK424_05850 [Legionella sp.]|nr:MAG: hypothetical protein CK424_05850 [Legionella sp.]
MFKQWLLVTFILIAICVLVYPVQRYFIYFPSKEKPSRFQFNAKDMQDIDLRTPDGLDIYAWYKPAQAHQPVILYLHGNSGHIGHRMYLVRQFLAEGFGVMLLEYRGYGGNAGQPSELGLYIDGRTALRYLQAQHSNSIVIFGESLGTGVATQLASEFSPCALILQSPYTTLTAVARYLYPWIPIVLIDQFDSLARIKAIHAPMLILHGKLDKIVPFEQGRMLYATANHPKQLQIFSDRGHNDLWDKEYVSIIEQFILTHCQLEKGVHRINQTPH